MNFRSILIAAALGGATLTALAHPGSGWDHPATPHIDQRQALQAERIEHGRRSGALTPLEAQRLWREQHAIVRAERLAKADGVVTPRERAHLTALLDRAGWHIQRELRDRQTGHRYEHRRITPHG